VTESSDGVFEFILPDSLKGAEGLKRRYVKVTFDRTTAIRNSEAEFMAIGHPFTNAVLKHCGSVDFGGLASSKVLQRSSLVVGNGALFNFTVKVTKVVQDSESVFFEFIPVFVGDDGTVASKTTQAVLSAPAEAHMPSKQTGLLADTDTLFEKANGEALVQCAQYQPWDEDVFCLNALRVEVV